ncbi:nuclear transport factor 2 family protein [Kutzneria chonburiensis]|jgi:ketosteroid isomerase-like protein|uniref:Nuclear transport factor 2 family protein n=1 Tax=Kutzneria chonburiensis TaxID=1483604 RepID=A0ABV6MQR0_9PSEU|nr:nuclear transport factor 2 family protein [Kutzneria chonburiensis]
MSTIEELEERWARAEVAGDVSTLDTLAAEEFRLVGPFGFVLDKAQWLDRYRGGDLVTTRLDWRDTQVRELGDTVLVIGIHDQAATYRGTASDGRFRSTHIWVRDGDDWRLAGTQLSPIGLPA